MLAQLVDAFQDIVLIICICLQAACPQISFAHFLKVRLCTCYLCRPCGVVGISRNGRNSFCHLQVIFAGNNGHDEVERLLLMLACVHNAEALRTNHCTLGAVYDTPHGVACAMMLPIVMEFNQECTGEKYREIARAMGVKNVDSMSQDEYRKAAIDAVRQLGEDVGIPKTVDALKEEDLDFLAKSAAADACAPGNPKEASIDDFKAMFRRVMKH